MFLMCVCVRALQTNKSRKVVMPSQDWLFALVGVASLPQRAPSRSSDSSLPMLNIRQSLQSLSGLEKQVALSILAPHPSTSGRFSYNSAPARLPLVHPRVDPNPAHQKPSLAPVRIGKNDRCFLGSNLSLIDPIVQCTCFSTRSWRATCSFVRALSGTRACQHNAH